MIHRKKLENKQYFNVKRLLRFSENVDFGRTTSLRLEFRSQSYKINFVLTKSRLAIKLLTVHYLK